MIKLNKRILNVVFKFSGLTKGSKVNIKKILPIVFISFIVIVGLSACANGSILEPQKFNPNAKTVGVSMPTKSLERWNHDGNNVKRFLEEKGYNVRLTYADNKIDQQVKDVESLIPDVDLLLVAPVDGYSLTQVLKDAKSLNLPVVDYDRLIMNSDAISYYVSFDNWKCGVFQGEYIINKLGLTDPNDKSKTYNMEIVAGEATDSNAVQYYEGALSVLEPYMKSGVLKTPSGQTSFQQCSTKMWDATVAMTRMQNILSTYYSDGTQLDVVLCNNDSVAVGSVKAIESDYSGKNSIIVTGQDGDEANLANMIAGKQTMTIYKPIAYEAMVAVELIDRILNGKKPNADMIAESNWSFEVTYDGEGFDNNKINVPAYLLTPYSIEKQNIQKELIDTGFYYWDENNLPKVVKN